MAATRHSQRQARVLGAILAAAGALVVAGCGSTRTSNTMRTATEQMLISDAIDRTVDTIDFTPLAGQAVFFDDTKLLEVVDKGYLVSSLRQRMLASGCVLKDNREEAQFVVEPRSGAVGTDNHDLLFGVPALQLPQVSAVAAVPAAIPEIPFAKRRDQRGVAKLAVFAYRRDTGEPVWQSGIVINTSTANDIWVLGAGPFQRGTIYDRPLFAGKRLDGKEEVEETIRNSNIASVDDEKVLDGLRRAAPQARSDAGVQQASAETPIEAAPADVAPLVPAPLADGAEVLPPPRPISEAPRP